MAHLEWTHLVGQPKAKEVLAAAFAGKTLGHAYLLCGEEGCGPFAAAVDMARAILCSTTQSAPCRECPSCKRIARGVHPDLHTIVPIALTAEHKSEDGFSDEGMDFLREVVVARLSHPYDEVAFDAAPGIPVAWMRQVMRDVNRGAVEGECCVVIMDGVDLLEDSSANAMLKTLEEPPPNTYLFLVTSRHHAVLPTIVSRCQTVRFGGLSVAELTQGLKALESTPFSPETIEYAVSSSMGSLSRALSNARNPDLQSRADAILLLNAALSTDWSIRAPLVDRLAQTGAHHLKAILLQAMHIIRSSLFENATLSETYIKESGATMQSSFAVADVAMASKICAALQEASGALDSHGNTGLILVHLIVNVTEILHGKKC